MQLVKLSKFRLTIYADGSRPDIRTLRRRIDQRALPGGFRDAIGRYWVDVDLFTTGQSIERRIQELTADPVVAKAVGTGV